MFAPERDHSRLNAYNKLITLGWLANTDITPCTTTQAVMNYIAKYASKEEKKSTSYTDLLKQCLPHVNSNKPLFSLVSKLMNKLVSERDWSAQEVCHLLLNLPLINQSRTVITVDCRPFEEQSIPIVIEDGEVTIGGKSLLKKYIDRPGTVENLTYIDYIRNFNHITYKRRPRAKPRLLNYFPLYKTTEDQLEDFCRVKIFLHHPFRAINSLKGQFHGWKEAYQDCIQNHHNHEPDGLDDTFEQPDEDEFESPATSGAMEEELQATWQAMARQLPNNVEDRLIDSNQLGFRDIDQFDWSTHVIECSLDENWWISQIQAHPGEMTVNQASQRLFDTLQGKQRQIFELVVDHYQKSLNITEPVPSQLLLQVDGKAGTGKSHVIWLLSSKLQELATINGQPNPVFRAAPTGVAAHGISGKTIHSLFRLPVKKEKFTALSISALTTVQSYLRCCKYLIIDEKSMISLQQLSFLDQRCRQVFPQHSTVSFGGLNIILFGDFFQLPPVGSKPLFAELTATASVEDIQGQTAYRAFNQTIELDVIMRQQGNSSIQRDFRDALEGLRHSSVSISHWKTLISRVQNQLTTTEVNSFNNALRIYGKKADVFEFNRLKLQDLQVAILPIYATNNPSIASKFTSDEAGNLHNELLLCIGARVMLTENLWTERGLVNGTIGTVRDIQWVATTMDFRKESPFVILVEFDGYSGPFLEGNSVPIFRSVREFTHGSKLCQRVQFPLTVAYAITIHKSQGITLKKAVMNLAEKDFAPGLSYVAVSRVKTLDGLMFEESFDYSRFKAKESNIHRWRLADLQRRRAQHVQGHSGSCTESSGSSGS
jgi:hypothetical protein